MKMNFIKMLNEIGIDYKNLIIKKKILKKKQKKMKQQLYFNILLKIDSYFILDRNTEIIKILKLFMTKKKKIIKYLWRKGHR